MKLINPFGKIVGTDEMAAEPRGCICSNDGQYLKSTISSCSECEFGCSHGEENFKANANKALRKGLI
ncbi:TPA: hypothetical protein ACG3R2_003799 [Clostridioides difficile]